MRSRPLPIVILALLHLLSPIFNAVACALLQNFSLTYYLQTIYKGSHWYELMAFFGLLPLAGVAILATKEWSYPLFLAIMASTFYSNFMAWRDYPQLFSLPMLLGAYVFNIGVVSYFLIPAVREVYLNPRVRWWETKPRYVLNMEAVLEAPWGSSKCTVVNLSEGGAFIRTTKKMDVNEQLKVCFTILGRKFNLMTKVVHNRNKGYGLQFLQTKTTDLDLTRLTLALSQIGVKTRQEDRKFKEELLEWATILMTTGKGLIPEIPTQEASPSSTPTPKEEPRIALSKLRTSVKKTKRKAPLKRAA